MATIFPSLISADILNLERTIALLDPYCAGYHIDIMDNNFVPNLTWGHQFANAIDKATTKPLWVHLMVDDPESLIRRLDLKSGSIVSFHIETQKEKNKIVDSIKGKSWLPGIAISPKTDLRQLFAFLPTIHQALIMSVEPGFSGQAFMPTALGKLEELATYRHDNALPFHIALDGGITLDTIGLLKDKGADQFAIASGIFAHSDPVKALEELTKRIRIE